MPLMVTPGDPRMTAFELAPGADFGPYRLEAHLGGGGFGEVWRATERTSGKTVALKILSGRYGSAEADRLRADVELLAAAAVGRDLHVVRVLGGGLEPLPHLIMEFVDGESLAVRLGRVGHLTLDETLEVGRAVAGALVALSRAGIVHRDVKAANVLLATTGGIKLADFGIAKIAGFDSLTAAGQLPMSVHYAAPEVWEGKGAEPADRYALGILLYECLVGHPPFSGGYAEVYRGHRELPPDLTALPAEVPDELRALIGDCLAKDPADRPPDHATLLARLEAVATALAAEAATVPPTTLGPWRISGPGPGGPWTFRATHEKNGATATVEVVFGELALGEALRRAVAVNPTLVPLGAERLLATNRLILRPGEAWPPDADPGGPFAFWVAREELPIPRRASLRAPELRASIAAITRLRDAAADAGLVLDLGPERLVVLPDGAIYLRRPGIPPTPAVAPDAAALATLQALPLPAALAATVAAASDLATLDERLAPPPPAEAATIVLPEEPQVIAATELAPAPIVEVTVAARPPAPAPTIPVAPPSPWRSVRSLRFVAILAAAAIVLVTLPWLWRAFAVPPTPSLTTVQPTTVATDTPGSATPAPSSTSLAGLDPPSALRVTAVDSTTLRLDWMDNSTNETGFRITDGAGINVSVGAGAQMHIVDGLEPGTFECFRVDAYEQDTYSTWTPSRCASTPPYDVDHNPSGVAFDAGTNTIWVANYDSDTVTKLDAATGEVLKTIPVGDRPHGVAVDGRSVWVTEAGDDHVTKLDASSGNKVNRYPTGGDNPRAVAFDKGTNSIWITNAGDDTVTKLDASNGAVLKRIDVGNRPSAVAVDGTSIWVANTGDGKSPGTVTKLAAATGAIVKTIRVGIGILPFGVLFDGTNIWVTSRAVAGTVTKLDAASGNFLKSYKVGIHPYGVVSDGTNIWMANDASPGKVTKLDVATGRVVDYKVGEGPTALAFDGTSIWVTNAADDNVSKVPIDPTSAAVPVTVLAMSASGASVSATMVSGQMVTVSASGTWCMGTNGSTAECGGPAGIRRAHSDESDLVLPSEMIGTLIGRIGSGPWFAVSANSSFTASAAGTLVLAFNDRACCYFDNSGYVSALLAIGP
jgi:YVTN family beta-propeller protein